ncbi:MAG: hypothetical protein H6712_15590 [Myxococcales bacterium]|nr:hypothetical protein [Myxococcales bacterium]MCB9715290.1 hypothetical protein [Myxococcales bacterium]
MALGAPLGAGCDFFQELKSEPIAGTETDTDSSGSGGSDTGDPEGPCELARDDRCLDQDTVRSCDLQTGELAELDCPALCGSYTNFSCVSASTGQHACWCVEPGPTKTLSCTELEACLEDCDSSPTLACADQCFRRTDPLTIRILGALLHCAEATCEDTCLESPSSCPACVSAARLEGEGGCSLPRAICDDDRNPDEPWP